MVDGEEIEWFQSYLRSFGKSIKEITPSHQHDLANAVMHYGVEKEMSLGL